jgi:outer membrane receptor protein involved in Fe transport
MTSWYANHADSRWDGDGTQAPAIDMSEKIDVRQFTQDIRYNFSWKSRLNGTVGASYWREKVEQTYWFAPNEQYMSYLILQMPQYLVNADGSTIPMSALPLDPKLGSLAGMPLPANHQEENVSGATNQAADLFLDATWRITRRLHFTGGVRATYENFRVTNQSVMKGGDPSVLGMLTGMYPNLFFKVMDKTEVKKSWKALTSRASLAYELRPDATVFLGYSRGRRPHAIQFDAQGNSEILNQEILNSFDGGFKIAMAQRLWVDLTVFYQLFSDFQTSAWVTNNYLILDAGKATSYGAETSIKAALLKILDVFGNYSFMHSRFDKIDSQGNTQEYGGNTFRLTPENSFTLGFNMKIPLGRDLRFFLDPYYTWKSHIWFEDANTPGLDQNAFGLLYANAGFSWSEPAVSLAFSGSNLLDEKYIISAGNTGTMFVVPTFIPGAPRMVGARITWRF